MNTPAHLIIGWAAFGDPGRRRVTAAALAGAILPDLSLYLLAGTSIFILSIPPQVVFDQLYFSDEWQLIFAIDNSFLLWGALLAFAAFLRSGVLLALSGAALLHLLLDFGLHHDDARRHFWPLTDWVFVSPFSYWDPRHYGGWIGPLEVGLALSLCLILWRRFTGALARTGITLLALAELAPMVMWTLMFAGT